MKIIPQKANETTSVIENNINYIEKKQISNVKINKFTVRELIRNSEFNQLRKEKREKPTVLYGARPFVHLYPSGNISFHLFGVKFDYNYESNSNHGNSFTGVTETMSRNSRVRLLKKTSALEFLGEKPTHMLTLTLPPEKFEMLTNDEKVFTWNFAKSFFLRKLQKVLANIGAKALWFQEFQKRGAPHLHILIDFRKLTYDEWKKHLAHFIKIWKSALKWGESDFPSQSVKLEQLQRPDFRYARKYASKLKQKDAPFAGKWGKWWGVTGEWRGIKENREVETELPDEIQRNILAIRGTMNWIAWDEIKVLDEKLYDKIMLELSKKRVNTKEKWTLRRAKGVNFDMKMDMLFEEKERRKRGEKTMEEIEEEKEYQRRKDIAKARYNAYLKQKNMHSKNTSVTCITRWPDWVKMYPLERLLNMKNTDIEAFFKNIAIAKRNIAITKEKKQKDLTLL